MGRLTRAILAMTAAMMFAVPVVASEPDYTDWQLILERYYDPARGMDYRSLKSGDAARLGRLRALMSTVDPSTLSRDEQLAFWINFYNISVVGIVIDHYPVRSIREISTDPIIRLNVFRKDRIAFQGREISLDFIEHEMIRPQFTDPRIHFAINCAAEDCPPIRMEPYVGARVDEQLNDQTRRFLNGPKGVRLTRSGHTINVYATRIMDWFREDFDDGGGRVAFLVRYLSPEKARILEGARKVDLRFDDYSWILNDWKR